MPVPSSGVPVTNEPSEPVYAFGPFRVHAASLQLIHDGQPVALTPKVFDTLLVLLQHRHRVVGKDELMRLVWRDAFVSEDSLSQCISSLRRALGDDPNHPVFVATIPRRGYRLIAPVSVTAESPGGGPLPGRRPMVPSMTAPSSTLKTTVVWAIAALAVFGTVFAARNWPRTAPASGSVGPMRLSMQPAAGTSLASGALLSPDGRQAAFVARDDRTGSTQLWIRTLSEAEPRPVPGTEDASKPFWAPTSDAVGFFAGGSLKKVRLASGPPQTIANVGLTPAGGSWGVGGTILFAGWRSPVFAVPESGGTPRPVTTLDPAAQDRGHQSPQFLPDGRRFLYFVAASQGARVGTWVGSIDSADTTRIVEQSRVYLAPGHLLFVRDRTLMAQAFDTEGLRLTGEPRALAGDVSPPGLIDGGAISASAGDLLSFGGSATKPRMIWVDRTGQMLSTLEGPAVLHNPTFSRDHRQVLGSGNGVWLVDLERGAPTKIVQDGTAPRTSPDGAQVAFTSNRLGGIANIYLRSIGRAEDDLLLQTGEHKIVNDWSPDGQYVVYVSTNPRTKKDIWLLPMSGNRTPTPFLASPANEIQAQVSPDGRWLAYASDESGPWEVYVQAFPGGGGKRAVSMGGGAQPQWRSDGGELFYLGKDRQIMAVTTRLGASPEFARPVPLFRAPVSGDLNAYRSHFAVSADGERFLIDTVDARSNREPISVLVNWSRLIAR